MDRNKLKLTALLLMVTVPLSLSTWFFITSENSGIGATTNKGELIIPPLDITALELVDAAGQPSYLPFDELVEGVDPEDYEPRPWQLLYLGGAACDEACAERLYFLRQIHTRLGREVERVERVYVQVTASPLPHPSEAAQFVTEQQPGMKITYALENRLRAVLPQAVSGRDPIAEHYIYVMDPVGNVMLYFTPENTPEEILSDLQRLLRSSSLG